MRQVTRAVAIALVLAATAALATEGVTDPTVQARQALMGTVGMNTKILGDMAGGKAPFDAAAAEAAKAALVAAAADIGPKFEPQATDPLTKAKPEIWTDWAGFMAKAEGLGKAAAALDATTLEGVQAGMGGIGGSCKDCHSGYRL